MVPLRRRAANRGRAGEVSRLAIAPATRLAGSGVISSAAHWIMMHASGGSTTAGHLHAQGSGDGTPGNHSSGSVHSR